MKLLTTLRYCLVQIAHDWLRNLLTIISIAALVCVYLMCCGLIKDLDRLSDSTLSFPSTLLLLMTTNSVFPSDSHLFPDDLNFYVDTIKQEFGEDVVEKQIQMIYSQVYLDGDALMVTGVDHQDLIEIAQLELVEGSWPTMPYEILINKEFRSITGRDIGDVIKVYGTDFFVTGISSSPLWRNAAVILTYEQAVALYGKQDGFQIGVIQLAKGIDPFIIHDVVKSVERNASCCSIFLHDHFNAVMQNAFKGFQQVSSVAQVVSLMLITFGAYNASALAMAEHRRLLILLRVVGFSDEIVKFFLFLCTLMVMLIAYLLGLITAFVIILIKTQVDIYSFFGIRILMDFDWRDILLSLSLMILLTAFGVLISFHKHDPLRQGHDLKTSFQGRVG
jgi:hypothetical protein